MHLDANTPQENLATLYDAEAIRAHFGAAAKHYDAFSSIQQITANHLTELIPYTTANIKNGILLDLGCGTGSTVQNFYREYQGHCIGLDLTYRMLKNAHGLSSALQADMQQLPIRAQSIDLLISNSSCQWVAPKLVIAEIQRVLKPGGYAFISLFVDGSLPELKQNLSLQHRMQKLPPESLWSKIIRETDLFLEHEEQKLHLQEFVTSKALFDSIRGVGASISPERHKYLGKKAYKAMLSDEGNEKKLSWRTLYLVLKMPAIKTIGVEMIAEGMTETNSILKAG